MIDLDALTLKGRGTADDPVRRGETFCSFRGCMSDAVMTRVTTAGYFVSYCRVHERDAAERFDWKDETP